MLAFFHSIWSWLISFDPTAFWTGIVALATLGTFIVLVIAALVARGQLRETVKSRHAAELAELSRRWDEPSLEESRRLNVRYGDKLHEWVVYFLEEAPADMDDNRLDVLERIPNFLEDLAILQEVGAIRLDMIVKSLGGVIVAYWKAWEPTIQYLREREGYEPPYQNFERLAKEIEAALVNPP
jgi:hypothetical protein